MSDVDEVQQLRDRLDALQAQVGPPAPKMVVREPVYRPLSPQAAANIRSHAERFRAGYRQIEWRGHGFKDPGPSRPLEGDLLYAAIAMERERQEELRRAFVEAEEGIAAGRYQPGDRLFGGLATVVEPPQSPTVRHLYIALDGKYLGTPVRLEEAPRVPSIDGAPPRPIAVVEDYVIVHEGWRTLNFEGIEWAPPDGRQYPIRYPDGRSCVCHPEVVAEPVEEESRRGLFGLKGR